MRKKDLYRLSGVTASVFLALLLSIFVGGDALGQTLRQSSGQADSTGSPQGEIKTEAAASKGGVESVKKAAPSGGPKEGIKVHGHWVIEVRNPDGTLATRREFENAFFGASVLNNILTRSSSVGGWRVQFSGVERPCIGAGGTAQPCNIVESTSSLAGNNIFNNLTVTLASGGVVLNGSATAQRNGDINQVSTVVQTCPSSTAPASCPPVGTGASTFTQTSLTTPETVVTGQQILVTVTISFS